MYVKLYRIRMCIDLCECCTSVDVVMSCIFICHVFKFYIGSVVFESNLDSGLVKAVQKQLIHKSENGSNSSWGVVTATCVLYLCRKEGKRDECYFSEKFQNSKAHGDHIVLSR